MPQISTQRTHDPHPLPKALASPQPAVNFQTHSKVIKVHAALSPHLNPNLNSLAPTYWQLTFTGWSFLSTLVQKEIFLGQRHFFKSSLDLCLPDFRVRNRNLTFLPFQQGIQGQAAASCPLKWKWWQPNMKYKYKHTQIQIKTHKYRYKNTQISQGQAAASPALKWK